MLGSNLLKSKIPISRGRGVGGTNFQLLMLSLNLLKKIFFAKNFLSFQAKIGTDLFSTLSTKWFAYIGEPQ